MSFLVSTSNVRLMSIHLVCEEFIIFGYDDGQGVMEVTSLGTKGRLERLGV